MISKSSGLAVLVAVGSVFAVGCNDSTLSECVSACEHILACETASAIDAGSQVPDAGTSCQDGCNGVADAGYNGCKNPGAAYDCLDGLSCQDLLPTPGSEGLPPALVNCATKAECPAF